MDILSIAHERIKLSPRSITVKNTENKTIGVVRGITKFKDLRVSESMKYLPMLRKCGVWGSGYIDNVIFCDGKMYYLHNLRKDENYYKYFAADKETFKTDFNDYELRQHIKQEMKDVCTVIDCYMI